MVQLVSTKVAGTQGGLKCVVYGKSGVGKTVLLSTAPSVVIISAESGLLSLRHMNIPVIIVRNVKELGEAYTWAAGSAEAKQFQTIGLDSISEIGEMVLSNSKALLKDQRQVYTDYAQKMTDTIKFFRDLPGKHVVLVAKEEVDKDALGMITNRPMLPGNKMGAALPYLMDEVFRLGVNKTPQNVEYRYLQTQPDLQSDAKDRSGALDLIERPDLSFVFNKILTGA